MSTIAESGNTTTVSSISYNNNGDITRVAGSTYNSKTGESASAAYDFGNQESIANASPTAMSSTAPSLQANWCYNGACRTGIMPNIDTRTISQISDGLEDLNSGMSMLFGGLWSAALFKTGLRHGSKNVSTDETAMLMLESPKMIKHHLFNVFRGKSPKSQKYRDFFEKHGIQLDSHTVRLSDNFHRKVIHQAGNNWTTRWKRWIDANPNATTKEVYQQAGRMMDDYKINHVNIVPYK